MRCSVLILFCLILLGCKTQYKESSNASLNKSEGISIQKEEVLYNHIDEVIQRTVEQIISEQLDINKTQRFYDVSKPIDTVTGQHPLVSEVTTLITKKTDSRKIDSTKIDRKIIVSDSLSQRNEYQSEIIETVDSIKEGNKVNEITIFLKWLGIAMLIGGGIFLYRKIEG